MPTIKYLTNDNQFSDFRPVFDPTGDRVLFERKPVGSSNATLHLVDVATLATSVFLHEPNPPSNQTRPDWHWGNDRVAFASASGVWLIGGDGISQPFSIGGAQNLIYPSWFPGAGQPGDHTLALMAPGGSNAGPHTTIYTRSTGSFHAVTDQTKIYAGMPSVNKKFPRQIAFAGQLNTGGSYNQTNNQIWLNVLGDGGQTQVQIEAGQGRAPWWSPDGTTIAFESNRADPTGNKYGIYLMSGPAWKPALIAGTDIGSAHPKWSPDGKKIVCAMAPPGGGTGRMCIAMISGF